MKEITNSIEVTSATLDERVSRLRAQLHSSPQRQQMLAELFPADMAQTDRAIVDFTDWREWSKHW